MFGDGLPVAVAPDLVGDDPDFLVGTRIVLEAGRLLRPGPDDGRSGLDEIADLADRFDRHRGGGDGRDGQGQGVSDRFGDRGGGRSAVAQDKEEEKDPGPEGQGPGDGHALGLAGAQPGDGSRSRAVELDEGQGGTDARPDLGLRELPELEAEGDVVGDRPLKR